MNIFLPLRYLISIFLLSSLLYANKVEIESLKFEANEQEGFTIFTGNVVIKKGADVMFADKVSVFTDKNRQIEYFEAVGNTSFVFNFEDNLTYIGSSDKFIYTPKNSQLKLIGNAKIKDTLNSREITGEEVLLDEKTKVIKVLGAKAKPVKLIFEIDEGNNSEL